MQKSKKLSSNLLSVWLSVTAHVMRMK